MVPFESLDTVSSLHFIATVAVSLAICEIFSVKELNLGLGSFKVIEYGAVLLRCIYVGHCKYSSVLYHF